MIITRKQPVVNYLTSRLTKLSIPTTPHRARYTNGTKTAYSTAETPDSPTAAEYAPDIVSLFTVSKAYYGSFAPSGL
ncbi:MAG: hypothetical protein ACLTSK_03170 [Christensenellales bacterium]